MKVLKRPVLKTIEIHETPQDDIESNEIALNIIKVNAKGKPYIHHTTLLNALKQHGFTHNESKQHVKHAYTIGVLHALSWTLMESCYSSCYISSFKPSKDI